MLTRQAFLVYPVAMNFRKHKKVAIFGAILFAVYIGSTIELPLPPNVAEYGTITGYILDCDIPQNERSNMGGNPEIGITLENNRSIYLRWKRKDIDMDYVDDLCQSAREVSVSYRVNRTLISPSLSYWIESLSEV